MADEKVNVIDNLMSRAKDLRGKVFDVDSEFDPKNIQPVLMAGYVVDGFKRSIIVPGEEERARQPKESEDWIITFRTSTAGKDRHGTKIRTDGIDTKNYEKNPIFCWAHDAYGGWFSTPDIENTIGRCVDIRKESSGMEQDIEFASEAVNPKAERALRMVLGKFLRATSIGFIPRQVVVEMEDEKNVPVIVKSELLEASLVPIPSNPDALKMLREMAGLSETMSFFKLGELEFRGPIEDIRSLIFNPAYKEVPGLEKKLVETPPTKVVDSGVDVGASIRRAFQEWQVRHGIREALSQK